MGEPNWTGAAGPVDTSTQGVIADTIGTQVDAEARRKFWLAHMRIGGGIFWSRRWW